jgi:hypothetical protein
MTASELQVLRDDLVKAIAAGLLELTSGDKTLRYQSTEQMRAALAVIDNELARANGSGTSRSTFTQFSRG